jgi:hypothetical protein
MSTKEKFSVSDSLTAPQCPSAVYAQSSAATASLREEDSPTPADLDSALLTAAEEMRFDWPALFPAERVKARIMEIALGLFLFAALVAFPTLKDQ